MQGKIVFRFDYKILYDYTQLTFIGPDTSSVRTLLEPDDAEWVFVAPDGDNNDDGLTPATAVLDLLTADIVAVSSGRSTIQCLQGSFPSNTFPIALGISPAFTLSANKNIQAELGTICEIDMGSDTMIILDNCGINGLRIWNTLPPNPAQFNPVVQASNFPKLEWCDIAAYDINSPAQNRAYRIFEPAFGMSNVGPIGVEVQYNIFRGLVLFNGTIGTFDYHHNIHIGNNDPSVLNVFGLLINQPTIDVQVSNCNFVNFQQALRQQIGPLSPPTTQIFLNRSIITNCDFAYGYGDNPGQFFAVTFTDCFLPVNIDLSTNVTPDPSITVVVTNNNPVEVDTPPYFVDAQKALRGNEIGLQLQAVGKPLPFFEISDINIPAPTYFLTSLLHEFNGNILGAWQNSIVVNFKDFQEQHTLTWPPSKFTFAPEPVNPITLRDPRANPHTSTDGQRWVFIFQFDGYANNENLWKLINIQETKGTALIYPVGLDTSFYNGASSGTFNKEQDRLFPFFPGADLIPNHWRGWHIKIEGNFYYIDYNVRNAFHIINKFDSPKLPDGEFEFTIERMTVVPSLESITAIQERFNSFKFGGDWTEKDVTDTKALEYNSFTVTFNEAADLTEI